MDTPSILNAIKDFPFLKKVYHIVIILWVHVWFQLSVTATGGFPYPTISNEDLILLLKNGYRMEKPDNCSPEM